MKCIGFVVSKGLDQSSQSPDLNPIDSFLSEYLKNEVYHTYVETINELLEQINTAAPWTIAG